MALDPSLMEIVNSLDLSKVPDKLHCAKCHKLLLNAYKATCCESSICEPCFQRADNACPICDHKPFSEDICKPSKAMRNTVKAYLKSAEKLRAEEGTKPAAPEATPAETPILDLPTRETPSQDDEVRETSLLSQQAEAAGSDHVIGMNAEQPQPSIENPEEATELHSDLMDAVDDEVEIQVEPSQDDEHFEMPLDMGEDENDVFQPNNGHEMTGGSNGQTQKDDSQFGMQNMNFENMMNNMGFNNMDYSQMMQMMAAGGMSGFNPMMSMPMGMNPMASMFGGFGGLNGNMNGMNGMNMNMNFNQNQGMSGGWNGPNNNMWQSNNANTNAFSNGMIGDFNSNQGFNFNQQQMYSNGDFQSGYYGRGYGRGRGRGRGGYGRGRGNFQSYSQHHQPDFQIAHEQQQYNIQNVQSQMLTNREDRSAQDTSVIVKAEEPSPEDDEFAPGGQEEVQEALGDDYAKTAPKSTVDVVTETAEESKEVPEEEQQDDVDMSKDNVTNGHTEKPDTAYLPSPKSIGDEKPDKEAKPIPEAYGEDIDTMMPPPSAPLGPSAKYGDGAKDFGFRSRGHGRFASRSRGSISGLNGYHISPVKPTPPAPSIPSPDPKGPGVIGAPTGPRAMRDPAPKPPARTSSTSGGGFQIIGRASMTSTSSQSRNLDRTRSHTPDSVNDRDYKSSRRQSRQDGHESWKYDADEQDDYDRDRERKRRKSRREDHDDYDTQEQDGTYSRGDSPDRKSSHRSRRDRDRDKYSSSSKHHSSSRRHRNNDNEDEYDYEVDDHGSSAQHRTRDNYDSETRNRSSHKSGSGVKSSSSKYDDQSRDKYREEKHYDRDRDRDRDRNRKRSRHDRDRDHEEDYEDDYDSRHRSSRRHKKDHHHRDDSTTNGLPNSHRSSEAATPTTEVEKDPHTLEREARNRERMLKEQQRREKAAKSEKRPGASSSTSGSRRVSYKYEDEAERGMLENERATARWR